MSEQPWMPFYVDDFRIDTLDLDADEIGVYVVMLCLCWRRKGPLPGDPEQLKRLLSACFAKLHGHTFNRIVPKLLERYFYRDEDGDWRQKRVEKELQKADKLSAKQKQNADKRWANEREKETEDLKTNDNSDASAMPLQLQSQLQLQVSTCSEDKSSSHSSTAPAPPDAPATDLRKIKRERTASDKQLIQSVGEAWNDLALSIRLPTIQATTPKRDAWILARAKDLRSIYDFEEPMDGFRTLFEKIRGSPFLRGDKGNFRADFDFAMKQDSFTKIMEGRYADQAKVHYIARR